MMDTLSRHRRHPAARALLLVAALLLLGGLCSVMPGQRVSADAGDAAMIDDGKKLFSVNCSSCHGLNAEGIKNVAPPLIGVGAAAVDFQMETGRMPAAGGGVQVPRKPNTFSSDEVHKIGAYVASLGQGPAVPDAKQYSASGLSEEEIARGGELFRTNCSACHNISGQGGALSDGKYAPTLVGVQEKHIYEAMRTGPQQMPVFSKGVVTDQDAREIIGYLKQLHAQPDRGGATLGGIGPVTEGLFAWIAGVGILVLFAVWIAAKGARAK